MPIISVIVPTRKRNHLLPRALQSVYKQTFQDFEILLVDDNPPENRVSLDPVLRPILEDSRLRILTHENPRNASAARNCGLRAACGEWITYLDDDDSYEPTKLEKQLAAARRTGLPLGLCGMAYILVGRTRARQSDKSLYSGNEMALETLPGTPVLFHRATDLLFDEELNAVEDAAFFFTLVEHFKTDRVFNVPEPLVNVFLHSGPRVNRNVQEAIKGHAKIAKQLPRLFDNATVQTYEIRTRLQALKFSSGGWFEMASLASRLIRLRGTRESRLILNAALFKIPGMRRFLV